MEKPVVLVADGTKVNQLASDALDALLASGDYSNAMELNSRLMSATTDEDSVRHIMTFVEVLIG